MQLPGGDTLRTMAHTQEAYKRPGSIWLTSVNVIQTSKKNNEYYKDNIFEQGANT